MNIKKRKNNNYYVCIAKVFLYLLAIPVGFMLALIKMASKQI